MRLITAMAVGATLAALAGSAHATIWNIADKNSTAQIDSNAIGGIAPGMNRWEVDNLNHLYSQWFWYRTPTDTQEYRINNLPILFENVFNTNSDPRPDTFTANYGKVNELEIEVSFKISGGTAGSGRSDIAEQISIMNHGSTALSMSFFQYCDFDLANDILDDYVGVANPNAVVQADLLNNFVVTETVVTPAPTTREVSTFALTLIKLDNNVIDNLDGNGGPLDTPRVDYTWAFQWDIVIPAGSSFQISKDKNLLPAPSAAAVLGLGLVGLKRRRRA